MGNFYGEFYKGDTYGVLGDSRGHKHKFMGNIFFHRAENSCDIVGLLRLLWAAAADNLTENRKIYIPPMLPLKKSVGISQRCLVLRKLE